MAYTYDATGRKLRSTNGIAGQTRDYVDGIEYTGGAMELIAHEEGRITRSGSTYSYQYFLRDHLGNNRVGFAAGVNVTVPNFSTDYYPFGLTYRGHIRVGSPKNNYLYNGKELQDGLRLYDYGARLYDPVIARWSTVDPLSEKYVDISPYAYVADNPIKYIDIDGREIVDPKGNTVHITASKNGSLSFSSNATPSIVRAVKALNLTSTGREQLDKMIRSNIKVKINVLGASKIERRSDGKTSYVFGETIQGNFDESDNYGRFQNKDGTFGIKESTITIYEGTIEEGIKDGNGLRLEGLESRTSCWSNHGT